MATDGPTPPDCDRDVFQHGETIATGYGSSNAVERWVKTVAAASETRLDWHYTGGMVNILFLGTPEERVRAEQQLEKMRHDLDGELYRILPSGAPQPYRRGVTPVPAGTVAVSSSPDGPQEIIVHN